MTKALGAEAQLQSTCCRKKACRCSRFWIGPSFTAESDAKLASVNPAHS